MFSFYLGLGPTLWLRNVQLASLESHFLTISNLFRFFPYISISEYICLTHGKILYWIWLFFARSNLFLPPEHQSDFLRETQRFFLKGTFEQLLPNFCRLFVPRKQSSSLLAFPEGCSREKLPSFPPDLPPPWNKNGAKNQNWTKNKICDQFFERKRPKIQNLCLWQKQKLR